MRPPRLVSALRRRGADLLAVLLPSPCIACDRLRDRMAPDGVCLECWAQVEYLAGPACPCCGRPHPCLEDDDLQGTLCGGCLVRRPPFDAGLSMAWYRGSLRALIRLLKFHDRPDLAAPLASRALVFLRGKGVLRVPPEVLVPVPLPPLRRLRRGYNQSAEVALALGKLAGLPVRPRALRRLGGRPQAGLPAARREANVRGAFVPREGFAGRSVLLLDDVWTTGATLRECARALRSAGAGRVLAFSLARVPEDFDAGRSATL